MPFATAVAHVPEDRDRGRQAHRNLSIADNLIMKRLPRRAGRPAAGSSTTPPHARLAQGLKDEYAIAAPSIDTQARLLSGGNLQRLNLRSRDRFSGPKTDGPPSSRHAVSTSGPSRPSIGCCSPGARRGTAILLISEDLDEILALADRIDVLYEGRVVGSFRG